jgi:uncharacterized protein (DUF1810 family)
MTLYNTMERKFDLTRFLDAQNQTYLKALAEIKNGCKQTHWMWFIFPQLKGLGRSDTANFYGILSLAEAAAYLNHPVLGKHLLEISAELLKHSKTAHEIFGSPDDLKLWSSMTLFSQVVNADPVFASVLKHYFDGEPDPNTIKLLSNDFV